MRKFIAALLTALCLVFVSAPFASAEQTYQEAPDGYENRMSVTVNSHEVSSTSIEYDKVQLTCEVGCGVAGSYKFNNVDIELRGSGGALLWGKYNVDIQSQTAGVSFFPNVRGGKGAYWEIPLGFINRTDTDRGFGDSWKAYPTGSCQHCASFYNRPVI